MPESFKRPPVKWASITVHPSLPSKALQIAGARAWGAYPVLIKVPWLPDTDASKTYFDDISDVGRTTRWEGKLPMRDALIADLASSQNAHNQVFFKTPLCVGFSEKHARDTLERIFASNALIYVQSEMSLYHPDDDIGDLIEAVGREAKAAIQRRYRSNKAQQ